MEGIADCRELEGVYLSQTVSAPQPHLKRGSNCSISIQVQHIYIEVKVKHNFLTYYINWLFPALLPRMHIICAGGSLGLSSAWCSYHSLLS